METVKKMVVSATEEQFKGVVSLVMAEIKTLSQQGKDLINSDFTEAVLSEANNLGFDDEIQKFKKMSLAALEHPEELVENVSNSIKDHTKVIEKLKEAQEEIKNKAISTFKSKLKAYNIPESVCSIFAALMTKNQEKLEKELAALISSGSKHILELDHPIPEDLIISCLQLVNHPKNLKTAEEIGNLVVKDLLGSIFNVWVKRMTDGNEQANENVKGTFIKINNLISAAKNRDKSRIMQILSELIRSFRFMDRNYEDTLLILFQIIASFGDVESLPQVKQSITSIIENLHLPDNKLPIKTFKEMFLFAMGGFPDATLEIAGVRLKEFQQIHSFLLNGLKGFGINYETKEEVCLLLAFFVKLVKNQWEPGDFDQLDPPLSEFFLMHPTKLEGFLTNVMHFLPFMYFSGKNQKVFWSDVATRLEIDKQIILELMFLTTENVFLVHNPSRIGFLETHTSFWPEIQRKCNFYTEESFLGFLELIFEGSHSLVGRYMDYFFNEVFGMNSLTEDLSAVKADYRESLLRKKTVKLALIRDPFELLKATGDFCKNKDSANKLVPIISMFLPCKTFEFLMNDRSEIEINKETKMEFIKLETYLLKLKEANLIEDKLYDEIMKLESLSEQIKMFQKLLNIKEEADILKKKQVIPELATLFKKFFSYDDEGMKQLFFLVSKDAGRVADALEYFLPKHKFLKKPVTRPLVELILKEEACLNWKTINPMLKGILPNNLDANSPLLAKSFMPFVWGNNPSKVIENDCLLRIFANLYEKETLKLETDNLRKLFAIVFAQKFQGGPLKKVFNKFGDNAKSVLNFMTSEEEYNNLINVVNVLANNFFGGTPYIKSSKDFHQLISILLFLLKSPASYSQSSPHLSFQFEEQEDQNDENLFGKKLKLFNNCIVIKPINIPLIHCFFTSNIDAFANEFIIPFRLKHSQGINRLTSEKLKGLLSIMTQNPDFDRLSSLLNHEAYALESSYELISYSMAANKAELLEKWYEGSLAKKWCEKLSINFQEFFFLMNFFNHQLDLQELRQFIMMFGLDRFADVDLLMSLICFYLKGIKPDTLSEEEQMSDYQEMMKFRAPLFKLIEVDQVIANFVCDLHAGRIWNIRNLFIKCSNHFTHLLPNTNSGYIIKTIVGFVGLITNDKLQDDDIGCMIEYCQEYNVYYDNSMDTYIFLLFDQFGISPAWVLLAMGREEGRDYVKQAGGDQLLVKAEKLLTKLQSMPLMELEKAFQDQWLSDILYRSDYYANDECYSRIQNFWDKIFDEGQEKTFDNLWDIYKEVNRLGVSSENVHKLTDKNNCFRCLVLLILLGELKKTWKGYNSGIKTPTTPEITLFINIFDLLLSCIEKIKLLNEEFRLFGGFNKNETVKLFIPYLFLTEFVSSPTKDLFDSLRPVIFAEKEKIDDYDKKLKKDLQESRKKQNQEKKQLSGDKIVNLIALITFEGFKNFLTPEDTFNKIYDLKTSPEINKPTTYKKKIDSKIINHRIKLKATKNQRKNEYDQNNSLQLKNLEILKETGLFEKGGWGSQNDVALQIIIFLSQKSEKLFKGDFQSSSKLISKLLFLCREGTFGWGDNNQSFKANRSKEITPAIEALLAGVSSRIKSNYENLNNFVDIHLFNQSDKTQKSRNNIN